MLINVSFPYGYLFLIECALFLSCHFRQLWWPTSVSAFSNGLFQFIRPHWDSQPGSAQSKSWWVAWLILQHSHGEWQIVYLHAQRACIRQCSEGGWREGFQWDEISLPAQNGYSNYGFSCSPNPHYSSLPLMRGFWENILKNTTKQTST